MMATTKADIIANHNGIDIEGFDNAIQRKAFEELCKEAKDKHLYGRKFRKYVMNRLVKRTQKIEEDRSI